MDRGIFGKWITKGIKMKKSISKKLLLLVFTASSFIAHAQVTSGGSKQNWEKFSIEYDTVVVEETLSSSYPSTSKTYVRLGFVNYSGSIGESHKWFPELALLGDENYGLGMESGYELALGGYTNFTSINNGLHPAIDLSSIYEVGFQWCALAEAQEPGPFTGPGAVNSIEGGTFLQAHYGFGIMATIKPAYLTDKIIPALKDLYFDIGLRPDLTLYGHTPMNQRFVDPLNGNEYEITIDEGVGVGLNLNIMFGLRWKFIGIRYDVSNVLSTLAAPEPYYDGNYFTNETLYESGKFSIMLFF